MQRMTLRAAINRSLSRVTGFEIRRVRQVTTGLITSHPISAKPSNTQRSFAMKPAAVSVAKKHAAQVRTDPGDRHIRSTFFDRYPAFYQTSETAPYQSRLNLRHDAIFEQNREVFDGARVLDIASHDGRWSFAALQTGAAHVVGVEPRTELVEAARSTLGQYVDDPTRYQFIQGDIFDVLQKERLDIDVVLCLGFLYHTLRYGELLSGLRALNPKHLIIDTTIFHESSGRVIKLDLDYADMQRDAVRDGYSHGDFILVGSPSLPGLELMLNAYDFKIDRLSDWEGIIRDNPDASGVKGDYGIGRRITVLASSSQIPRAKLPLRGYIPTDDAASAPR